MTTAAHTQATSKSATMPIGVMSDASDFCGEYEVFISRNAQVVAFDVCDLEGTGMSAQALVDCFREDQKHKPRSKLKLRFKHDPLASFVPDFDHTLNLNRLEQHGQFNDGVPAPFEQSYLVFAKDDAGRVISYSAASLCVSFQNEAFDEVPADPESVANWLATAKERKLQAWLTLTLDEAYTLTEFRGTGANAATKQYLADVVEAEVTKLIETLKAPLKAHKKSLDFVFYVQADLTSKSGYLSASKTLELLEEHRQAFRQRFKGKRIPVAFPENVIFDVGF
jgi:hypothetical protein